MLIKSLKKQTENYESVFLDNTKNQYQSAAQALNMGAKQATGEYLVFVHQDVNIDDDFLVNLKKYFSDNENSILGVAGVKSDGIVLTNITQGPNHIEAGTHKIKEITDVLTLDEVLIAIKREDFLTVQFDEKVCIHWHLYGVELCLNAQSQGMQCKVIPEHIYHLSSGTLSESYAHSLQAIIKKHRKDYPIIATTCSMTKTDWYRSRRYIKGLLRDHGHIK